MKDINSKLNQTILALKEILKDADDIIYRTIECGKKQKIKMCLIYVDGMTTKEAVSQFAIETLMEFFDLNNFEKNTTQELDRIASLTSIATSEISSVDNISTAVNKILSGETMLFIDGSTKAIMISSRGWPMRSISEPVAETLLRGPRDGFNETLKVNITLIRRRIKDPKLKVKYMQVGTKSKTDVAIMYLEDRVNRQVLEELQKRLSKINIEAVLESSYIEELIEDDNYSPFPQVENTQRPDAAASAIYEGRVVIGVDNTPQVLMVPAIMTVFMQSSEDYYERWLSACMIRIVRYLALPITILLPALYVAITTFHPNMLPTGLALYVAASRAKVPFPAWFEASLIEITMELIREAGMRIVGPIGSTIGIVGGLVIGQAAVEAGLISPLVIIIVALTTISSFAIPSFNFSTSLRMLRFVFIILAATLGLFGVSLGICILLTHLCALKSMGVPYMTPFSSFVENKPDLMDTIIRHRIKNMVHKPEYLRRKK
ncbi:MAG TPA: spore germination protein [Clostridiales bacterium]|nr:spore germination protein [Clostridiales bacterium]